MDTTIITILTSLITFVISIGMISHEGNMNTWETLFHIKAKTKIRESEVTLEIEKERTKQAIEVTKQIVAVEFKSKDNVNYEK